MAEQGQGKQTHTHVLADGTVYEHTHGTEHVHGAETKGQVHEDGQTHVGSRVHDAHGRTQEHEHDAHGHSHDDARGHSHEYDVHEHSHDDVHGHTHTHEHDAHGHHSHTHTHDPEHVKSVLNRLSRAIGHLESIKRMVEDGRDCSEVLIQLSAVKAAINNTGKIILQDHIQHCLVDAVETGDMETIAELNKAIDRFIK